MTFSIDDGLKRYGPVSQNKEMVKTSRSPAKLIEPSGGCTAMEIKGY
jgi:hypothetical protein